MKKKNKFKMNFKCILFTASILPLCLSCSSSEDETIENSEIDFKPIEMTVLDKEIAENSYEFGTDFVKKNILLGLKQTENENIIVSPVSAAIAFSMAANSVNDQQAEDILDKLGQPDLDALNDYNKKLMDYLTVSNSISTIKFANRMWVDDSYSIPSEFTTVMSEKYGFTPETAGIKRDWKKVAGKIDKWCDSFTEHLIPQIAPLEFPGDVFIASGLVFKNQWSTKFSTKGKMKFRGAKGEETADKMVSEQSAVGFYYKGCEMVTLSYKDGRCFFTAVLPPEELTMEEFVNRMDEYGVDPVNSHGRVKEYYIILPKLSISTEVSLKNYLESEFPVFDNIDWSKAGVTKGCEKHILKQNVALELDEEGTTAAVVTSSEGYTANMPRGFVADRPFIFFITEKETGSIILAGVINTLTDK